jgi:hypothetical protein
VVNLASNVVVLGYSLPPGEDRMTVREVYNRAFGNLKWSLGFMECFLKIIDVDICKLLKSL